MYVQGPLYRLAVVSGGSGGFFEVLPESIYLPAVQKLYSITGEHWVVHLNCHY